MKTLPPALASHLASRNTTLARCWKVTRLDGQVFGFTEHDRDLVFDGVAFQADSALTRTQIVQSLGLAADNVDVAGALRSADISEDAIARGLFDFAEVIVYVVNWQDVAQRAIEARGNLGEVTRGATGFTAELRSMADRLAQKSGRVYSVSCDADLGDARCGFNLDQAAFKATGTVGAAPLAWKFILSGAGLSGFAAGWFNGGLVTLTSGVNAGVKREVKSHTIASGVVYVELWQPFPTAPAMGDAFAVTAGCDKNWATCKTKFSNGANFRGFPHMPGNDRVTAHPRAGEVMDGGSLFTG